ncbi:eclosion hormone-like [Battus philenor]|uniref:eclosion hormone-like n=1 Tax=Battus philenor TaxID=42288 RepID=UPI0035CF15D2
MASTCSIITILSVMVLSCSMRHTKGNPAIGKIHTLILSGLMVVLIISKLLFTCSSLLATGYDPLEICIENCAQCKKMLGAWFEGPLCAKSCIKFKGKQIPECEDFASISPFLNKL